MGIAISDADLLEASRRGEHTAFGALVERYQDVVSAVSYSRTRDQALSEDVAQETFLAAWRQLDQLREAGRLRSWLCGIARNLAAKARKRSVREMPSDIIDEAATDNPFDAVSAAQAEQLVGDALGRVPETYRDVLVLYYREQRSIGEVATMLDISEAAALQRLKRGRKHLTDSVTSLVERSLRALPKSSLVACVVAALPLIATSRVEAQPVHGGKMFIKIALATALLGAAGGTAFVATRSDAPPSTTAALSPTTTPASAKAAIRAPSMPSLTPQLAAVAPTLANAPEISQEKLATYRVAEGPSRGPIDAPVVVTVYTDMQCPWCAQSLGTIDQLMDEYPNALRIVVKMMPVHKTAELAAEAALAADDQGKFWELHDLMLQNQDQLERDGLLALAQQAGLDVDKLRTALDTHAFRPVLDAEIEAARAIEIKATPSFVINGRHITGLWQMDDLRAAVNAALAKRD